MSVGIEALEPDVGFGVLVLDEFDTIGDQACSEPANFIGRPHLETEVREPGTALHGVIGAEREHGSVRVVDDDPVGEGASRRGIEPEERA